MCYPAPHKHNESGCNMVTFMNLDIIGMRSALLWLRNTVDEFQHDDPNDYLDHASIVRFGDKIVATIAMDSDGVLKTIRVEDLLKEYPVND